MIITKKCSLTLCNTNCYAKGYCSRHYQQLRNFGSVRLSTNFDKRKSIILDNKLCIPLGVNGRDGYAIIDSNNKWLEKYNWYLTLGYAATKIKNKTVRMHRLIMNPAKKLSVDHINGNKLDNRTENLRVCTHKQNTANSKRSKNNTTGYKGVSIDKRTMKYVVKIGNKYIASFTSLKLAAKEYDRQALQKYGEFAKLNEA